MTFITRAYSSWIAITATVASAALAGCNSGTTTPDGMGGFISDNPRSSQNGVDHSGDGAGVSSSGAGGGDPGTPTPSGDEAERAIAEADIIQVKDGKLYALSQYSGLSIIDVSVRDELTLLGRHQAAGMPFEMYLRDGVVYAMFSSWGHYVHDEAYGSYRWVQTSRIEALDVSNPADIQSLGAFNLPGAISDSRIVGGVLYAVSFENGTCWGCGAAPSTTITSLSVANPTAIAVVDQLSYADEDTYGLGWRRSVSVTQDRMYVAGIEWDGTSEGHSTIQVIDISDPTGLLVEGASVEAAGQIQSRWQMDEHQGVLRVISQPGLWWSDAMPSVQTFQITSSHDIQPLGSTTLQLPMPETLRSVRFDGARAYAITAEQTDPLFTIDLSDPAQPQQMGELEMPGWVYHMEPRGDRLLALGFDNQHPEGSLHVSLFDVSDMTQPTMIQRVAFGGHWSSVAEDQDRIHKAFTILDDLGAILVPYSGWQYEGPDSYCGSYHSGIQIFDFTADSLEKRGVAASRGQARRAFVHDERLFSVSDEAVRTFNMSDRDAPAKVTDLALATVVSQSAVAGDVVVRLAADWWTTEARIEIAPASDPGRADPLAVLDLSSLAGSSPHGGCYAQGFYGARLFTHGQHAYVVRPSGDGTGVYLATIDLTDPTAPEIAGTLELPLSGLDGYGYYGPIVTSGEDVVQVGSTLVFRRSEATWYDADPTTTHRAWLEVVDLSDPTHPTHASTVALPRAAGHSALRVDGTTVLTSHWIPIPADPTKARFYLDRVDVASPQAPTSRAPLNVPGSLIAFDGAAGRLLTVDYQRVTEAAMSAEDCWGTFGYDTIWEPVTPGTWDGPGTCTGMRRALKLVDVAGSSATLRETRPIDDGTNLSSAMVGDDRVFIPVSNHAWYDDASYGSSSRVMVVGGMADGDLDVVLRQMDELGYSYPLAASGDRLLLAGYSPPSISVLDASDMDSMTVEMKGELSSYAYAVTVDGDRALCSMGQHGLQVIDLAP